MQRALPLLALALFLCACDADSWNLKSNPSGVSGSGSGSGGGGTVSVNWLGEPALAAWSAATVVVHKAGQAPDGAWLLVIEEALDAASPTRAAILTDQDPSPGEPLVGSWDEALAPPALTDRYTDGIPIALATRRHEPSGTRVLVLGPPDLVLELGPDLLRGWQPR